jgi:hypothetical protein
MRVESRWLALLGVASMAVSCPTDVEVELTVIAVNPTRPTELATLEPGQPGCNGLTLARMVDLVATNSAGHPGLVARHTLCTEESVIPVAVARVDPADGSDLDGWRRPPWVLTAAALTAAGVGQPSGVSPTGPFSNGATLGNVAEAGGRLVATLYLPVERGTCTGGADEDSDGLVDCADTDCIDDAACDLVAEDCDNGVDEPDADSDVDCADSECLTDPRCAHGEICDNTDDDDGDGDRDCDDTDCVLAPGCVEVEDCDNDIDDDDDGDIDCDDAYCVAIQDPDCLAPLEDCDNNVDDDEDTLADCDDPQCDAFLGCQFEVCGNLQDDDGDGAADCDDPDCDLFGACTGEPEDCSNTCDDDGDLWSDCWDFDCRGAAACAAAPSERCDDGVDNDGDGAVDCFDSADCIDEAPCWHAVVGARWVPHPDATTASIRGNYRDTSTMALGATDRLLDVPAISLVGQYWFYGYLPAFSTTLNYVPEVGTPWDQAFTGGRRNGVPSVAVLDRSGSPYQTLTTYDLLPEPGRVVDVSFTSAQYVGIASIDGGDGADAELVRFSPGQTSHRTRFDWGANVDLHATAWLYGGSAGTGVDYALAGGGAVGAGAPFATLWEPLGQGGIWDRRYAGTGRVVAVFESTDLILVGQASARSVFILRAQIDTGEVVRRDDYTMPADVVLRGANTGFDGEIVMVGSMTTEGGVYPFVFDAVPGVSSLGHYYDGEEGLVFTSVSQSTARLATFIGVDDPGTAEARMAVFTTLDRELPACDGVAVPFTGTWAAGSTTSTVGATTVSYPSGSIPTSNVMLMGIDWESTGVAECATVGEVCGNNRDDDGDGARDCLDVDCQQDGRCMLTEDCAAGCDGDGDGRSACADFDCIGTRACTGVTTGVVRVPGQLGPSNVSSFVDTGGCPSLGGVASRLSITPSYPGVCTPTNAQWDGVDLAAARPDLHFYTSFFDANIEPWLAGSYDNKAAIAPWQEVGYDVGQVRVVGGNGWITDVAFTERGLGATASVVGFTGGTPNTDAQVIEFDRAMNPTRWISFDSSGGADELTQGLPRLTASYTRDGWYLAGGTRGAGFVAAVDGDQILWQRAFPGKVWGIAVDYTQSPPGVLVAGQQGPRRLFFASMDRTGVVRWMTWADTLQDVSLRGATLDLNPDYSRADYADAYEILAYGQISDGIGRRMFAVWWPAHNPVGGAVRARGYRAATNDVSNATDAYSFGDGRVWFAGDGSGGNQYVVATLRGDLFHCGAHDTPIVTTSAATPPTTSPSPPLVAGLQSYLTSTVTPVNTRVTRTAAACPN